MKLSDAIRLGSMNGPQAFGETRNRRGGTCALGAALDAIGKRLEYHHALEFWPLLMKEVLPNLYAKKRIAVENIVRALRTAESTRAQKPGAK